MLFKMASAPLDQPAFSKTFALNGAQQKWSHPWTSSWQLRGLCVVCQSFTLFMTIFVPIYCVYQSRYQPANGPFGMAFAIGMACYISLNLFTNWHYFRWRQRDGAQSLTYSSEDVDWSGRLVVHVCSQCHLTVPDDSHHCPICDVCVRRRDHHCFFLGGCVGRDNLCHFLTFCLHASLGCGYATLFMLQQLNGDDRELASWTGVKDYIVPFAFVQWLLGMVPVSELFVVTLLNMAFVTCLGTLFQTLFHFCLVFLAKTSYEFVNRMQRTGSYSKSVRNFRKALGKNWYLRLLVPTFLCEGDQSRNLDLKFMKLV